MLIIINQFVFYHLKTLENMTVFLCFQEVEKVYIGNKWDKEKETSAEQRKFFQTFLDTKFLNFVKF